ncbi:hypothetical protein KIN20_021247 [Parelaphostrongylus tenuis]|uniref:Uncharacterized protein n=1 Tax=Parelaphostrongylus tenuis TaxID=148309 RepID=A0AAD5N7R0_PARTN|nr:hypothetical protein KIN20_021247 [Parelaphostrongylus tenuis]
MMRAAHESIHMDGMMEASEKPMAFRKLDAKSRHVLDKKNPVPLHHPTYLSMIKTKGHGASGSFKLGKVAKIPTKRSASRRKHARSATRSKSSSVKAKRSVKSKPSKPAENDEKSAKPRPRKASKAKKAKTGKKATKSATTRPRVQKKRGVSKKRKAPRAKKT